MDYISHMLVLMSWIYLMLNPVEFHHNPQKQFLATPNVFGTRRMASISSKEFSMTGGNWFEYGMRNTRYYFKK